LRTWVRDRSGALRIGRHPDTMRTYSRSSTGGRSRLVLAG
jgi:hypothetical protein